MSLSASDVSEPSVPECQRFRCARVLSQVQRSRGECSTFHFNVVRNERVKHVSVSNQSPPSLVVCLMSHSSFIKRSILAVMCAQCTMGREPVQYHAINHSGCWKVQSIRHNGFIYVQPWVPFITLAGSRPCPKNLCWNLKAVLFGQTRGAVTHNLTLSWGGKAIERILNANHQTSMGGPLWDEICGFVVLPLSSLVAPRGFGCNWLSCFFLPPPPHQSDRRNNFYCVLKWNITSYIIHSYLFV